MMQRCQQSGDRAGGFHVLDQWEGRQPTVVHSEPQDLQRGRIHIETWENQYPGYEIEIVLPSAAAVPAAASGN